MGETFSERYAAKLAAFQAAQALCKEREEKWGAARQARWVADKPRRIKVAAWKRTRTRKRRRKEELRFVLAASRGLLIKQKAAAVFPIEFLNLS
jgi:hypothetical protein